MRPHWIDRCQALELIAGKTEETLGVYPCLLGI
jgi:hypothetical protein